MWTTLCTPDHRLGAQEQRGTAAQAHSGTAAQEHRGTQGIFFKTLRLLLRKVGTLAKVIFCFWERLNKRRIITLGSTSTCAYARQAQAKVRSPLYLPSLLASFSTRSNLESVERLLVHCTKEVVEQNFCLAAFCETGHLQFHL